MKKTIRIVSKRIKVEIKELLRRDLPFHVIGLNYTPEGFGNSFEDAMESFKSNYLNRIGLVGSLTTPPSGVTFTDFTVEEVQDE